MLKAYRLLGELLSSRERMHAKLVLLLMLIMAFLDTVGIASVMPFVAVLSNPEFVKTNYYLAKVYNWFGYTSPESFLFSLGILLFILFVISLTFRALTTYAITRFSTMRLHSITCRLLGVYLRQPYVFFIGRNTGDLRTSILSEVSQVTRGVLVPCMSLISDVLVTIALFSLLLIVEPLIPLGVAVLLGVFYSVVYFFSRRMVRGIGKDRFKANKQRYILASEGLNGVKELKLMGREQAYLERFKQASERFAKHQAANQIIGLLPGFGIQAIAFGGVILMILYLLKQHGDLEGALPIIALYTFAGYRLMPGFQGIFKNIIQIRFTLPVLESLCKDYALKQEKAIRKEKKNYTQLFIRESIRLHNVNYRYPQASSNALNNINLTIPAGNSVGFVGTTGAGKSTIVDIILGLLTPSEGEVIIDCQTLNTENLRAWQDNIGYVPQTTYLADDTVAANIAFGIPAETINKEALEYAAKTAHIHDFIESDLEHGYDTRIGERGIKLSGGQRQRLAIARALYHNPDVVIFDEATSALDNATEAAVMEAVEELHGLKTVILIAHRLSTIKNCDRIFLLEKGTLIADGTYDELLTHSEKFIRMVTTKDS